MAIKSVGTRKVIDSSSAAISYAFETGPGVLATPVEWKGIRTITQGEFGPSLERYTTEEISPTRQNQLGDVVGLSAAANFDFVFRQRNAEDFLEGIFFESIFRYGYLTGDKIASVSTTAVTAKSGTSPIDLGFVIPTGFTLLVEMKGFTNAANNGRKTITATSATALTTTGLVAEATPPDTATVEVVGFKQTGTTAALTYNSGVSKLTGIDLTKTKLRKGSWIYIGGEDDATKLNAAGTRLGGVARVGAIETTGVTLDITSFNAAAATTAAGFEVYLPTRGFRNGTGSDAFYFQFERQLGIHPVTKQAQAEYVEGCIANTMSIMIPTREVVKSSMSFVAVDSKTKKDGLKPGIRPVYRRVRDYNTSSALKHMNLYRHDTNSTKTRLFSYLSDLTLEINNNVTAIPAIGIVGAYDVSAGNFMVTGSLTAGFNDTDAIDSVRNNSDMGLYVAGQRANEGFVLDVPLMRLGTAGVNVSQGEPLTLAIDSEAGENDEGYTVLMDFFDYLPE